MLPTPYVLTVGARQAQIARYERRGIKVINLGSDPKHYSETLAHSFESLREYWQEHSLDAATFREDKPLEEVRSTPKGEESAFCFFSMPRSLVQFYRDEVFPVAEEAGLVPVSGFDVEVPQGNLLAAIRQLIERSRCAVVDLTEGAGQVELGAALEFFRGGRLLLITGDQTPGFGLDELTQVVHRPETFLLEPEEFIARVAAWFEEQGPGIDRGLNAERLLEQKEWSAALIAAVSQMERLLADLKGPSTAFDRGPRRWSWRRVLNDLPLDDELRARLQDWIGLRNAALHEGRSIGRNEARQSVSDVQTLRRSLEDDRPY